LLRPAAAKELEELAQAVELYKQTVQQQESSLAGQQDKIMT
jgi:DNA-binding XRE family transcriptional regulator